MATPPVSVGADQLKVSVVVPYVPADKLVGAPGRAAATTASVVPSGPAPCTLTALTAYWYVAPAVTGLVTALVRPAPTEAR